MKYVDKFLNIFFSYLGTFLLGTFSASQFKFDDPVSFSTWFMVVFITLFFIIISHIEKN